MAGVLPHNEDRTALVVISPDEPAVQKAFAESRGWPFCMVSAAGTTSIRDLGLRTTKDGVAGWEPRRLRATPTLLRRERNDGRT